MNYLSFYLTVNATILSFTTFRRHSQRRRLWLIITMSSSRLQYVDMRENVGATVTSTGNDR